MRGRYFLGLVIMMAAISIGCGRGSGTHQDVPAGQLSVSPSTLDFGKVPVGQKATKAGTLRAGNATITVTSADWSGEGYSLNGIAFPVSVAAGQSVSFKVTFAPQRAGSSSGNINFRSDAANSPHTEAFSASGTQTGTHTVSLSWRASDSNAVGYNIYRAVKSNGPYSKINSSPQPEATFTDGSTQGGQTYFYVTTASNKHGTESKYSNEVQVMIPNS
jgi:hypothetical protein